MQTQAALLIAAAVLVVRADRYHPADRAGSAAAAAANLAETDPGFWVNDAQAAITENIQRTVPKSKARNVVMFLGDGMSVPTVTAARILFGQLKNATGEEAQMSFETFPSTGLVKVSDIEYLIVFRCLLLDVI